MQYSVFIDRGSQSFVIQVDYFIEPYYDPETGEAFSETSWTASYGGGGTGGWGAPESNTVPLELGMSAGPTLTHYTFGFFAQNTFSAVSDSLSLEIFEAGLSPAAMTTAGTASDDIIVSGSGDDVLGGGDGNDLIDSGEGNDQLSGGNGADRLDGGLGNDTMDGGAGDDSYRVDSGSDVILELDGGGMDSVESEVDYTLSAHVERLQLMGVGDLKGIGNASDNGIAGNAGDNILRGLAGNDQLFGDAGDDRLEGGAGNDYLDGGRGRDTMRGGRGDDTYVVDSVADQVLEGVDGGVDTVNSRLASYTLGDNVENLALASSGGARGTGNELANTLLGNEYNNVLFGLAGDDTLRGNGGNDNLIGGAGADQLFGGAGTDWASYETSTGRVKVNLETGTGTVGDAKGDSLSEVENLRGGAGDDTLTGDAAANRLEGGLGDDSLNGGDGNDIAIGGVGADLLRGGRGEDIVSYAGSTGGVVVNLVTQSASGGDATGDTLSGFEGAWGSAGNDLLIGSSGANKLFGDAGSDTIQGGGGDDVIEGGAGLDILSGGQGIDMLSYARADGGVTVNLATALATGSEATGDVFSEFEGIVGSSYGDTLTGDGFANRLEGGAGNDTIDGGAGDDLILGGKGNDVLVGGSGIDTLSYADATLWVSASLASGTTSAPDGTDTHSGFENLTGGRFGDALYGDVNDNVIRGGDGGDYISGGGGRDRYVGGAGDDIFVYLSSGRITVTDFQAGGTEDRLYINTGDETLNNFVGIMATATTTANGDTVFAFSGGNKLTLAGVDKASLTVDDFIFDTPE